MPHFQQQTGRGEGVRRRRMGSAAVPHGQNPSGGVPLSARLVGFAHKRQFNSRVPKLRAGVRERTLATAQKLSERTNRARIISICPLHNIVGV